MAFSERELRSILAANTPRAESRRAAERSAMKLARTLDEWGGRAVVEMFIFGSFAKGTDITGGADVDLFVSLSSRTTGTLQSMREDLFEWLYAEKGYVVRRQNVSARVFFGSKLIDVVPGKRQNQHGNDHSLWSREAGTYLKTNINKQVRHVASSDRQGEIRLVKIWRDALNLQCPSFLLELAAIQALRGRHRNRLAANFETVLGFLASRFPRARLLDPGNRANIVSGAVSAADKQAIAAAATRSLQARSTRSAFQLARR